MEEELINSIKLDSEFIAHSVVRLMKRDIFDRFMKTGILSEEDQEFCDRIDWYPVDELELREEYVEKLKAKTKESSSLFSVEEFNKFCNSL